MSYNAWRITYQNAEQAAQVAYQAARQHLEQVERLKQQLENLRYAGDRVIRGGEGSYVWNLAVNDSAQPSLVHSRIAELEEQASEAAAERDSYQREFARATEVLGEIHAALNGSGPSIVGMEAVQVLQLKGEREALAAHVERLREGHERAFSTLRWSWLRDLLDETPDTSLARLKVQWRAEAFDHPLIAPDMKAGCIGEFWVEVEHSCTACHFNGPDDNCEVCGGEVTYTRRHDVPWTTQKNIFKAMSAFKAASLRRQAEGGGA